MTIAERIRLTREQKGLSQVRLAELAGLNTKSLSRYERGTSVPPADTLKAIADALGVSADHLLGDDDTPIRDKELLRRFQDLQEINGEMRKTIDTFLDMAIRDHRTKKNYSG